MQFAQVRDLNDLYLSEDKVRGLEELRANSVDCSSIGKNGKKRFVILLDSGSSDNIARDAELLTIIWKSELVLDVERNSGEYEVDHRGYLPGVGEMWYSPQSVINVLSLNHMNGHPSYDVLNIKAKASFLTFWRRTLRLVKKSNSLKKDLSTYMSMRWDRRR